VRSRRLAWALVWLYPPTFRRDVGLSFVDALDDQMRARRANGVPLLRILAAAVADTLRNAPAEWVSELRHRSASPYVATRGERTMHDMLRQDVRYALRTWRRRPGFAFVAVLTLALGIAATTAMFSIVNAVLLRAIPYQNADRLVMLWGRTQANPQTLVSYREYDAIRRDSRAFDATGLWLAQSVNLTGGDQPQRLIGAFVTGSFFDVLGLTAERGRLFRQDESEPGSAQPVVVITHAFWQRRFAADPSAIGATLTLNGTPLTIVGILASPFDPATVPAGGWFLNCDALIPAGQFPGRNDLSGMGPSLIGVARLRPGVTLTSAARDLDVVSRRLQAAFPTTEAGKTVRAESVRETIVGTSRETLLLLFGCVGAVLLIACVNVSNLLLARAVDRQREMALRAALGASRFAVARQLLVEAALLTVVASALGLLAGRWSLQTLSWMRPPNVPIPDRVAMDGSVLMFAVAVSAVVALVCGVAPAIRSSRFGLSAILQAGFRRSTGTGGRTRETLVVVELALSVALLSTSGLLARSLLAVQQVPIGFDPTHVLTLQFRLPAARYNSKAEIARFFERAIERIRSVPGVESAAFVRAVPFSGNGGSTAFTVEGRPAPPGSEPQASYHLVTPDYFRTLRIPMLRGRDFNDRDDLHAPLVAVVNDTFARTTWPGDDPLGKRIKTADLADWITIVGVAGDAKHLGPTDLPRPQLYVSHFQNPQIFSSLVARTAAAPLGVANDVRRAIWSVDKDQPVWAVQPLDAIVDANEGQWRFMAVLVGLFATIAVALAGVGIYGVMAYSVAQRTHEIGIRLALGASASRVVGDVVRRGLRLTLVAVALGSAAAVTIARLATSVLFGVAPHDPATLSAAAALLAAVAMIACYVPARRAARVDPTIALAEE
jgi:putative ABC transport system permease protein